MSAPPHSSFKADPVGSGRQVVFLSTTLFILLAAGIGLHQALGEIHTSWTGKYGHFAHGYMALAFAIWLGLKEWKRRRALGLKPDWRALPLLLALLGMMAFAMRMEITTATQSLVPAVLISAFGLAFGLGLIRVLWWPAMCVYFAMPIWWILNTPLQELTALVCRMLVSIAGIPAIVSGHSFELPSGIIEVAQGCSGLNYLISALTLAYLYCVLFLQTWPARIKLLAVAAIAALLVNWIRVFSLICIAYATDMRHYLIRVDHLYFGWALFLLALWPIFWVGSILDRDEAHRGITEQPVPSQPNSLRIETRHVFFGTAVASACLMLPLMV